VSCQTKGCPGLVIQTGWLEGGAHDHIVVPKNTENPETMSATKNSVYLVNKKVHRSARQETVEDHKAAKA